MKHKYKMRIAMTALALVAVTILVAQTTKKAAGKKSSGCPTPITIWISYNPGDDHATVDQKSAPVLEGCTIGWYPAQGSSIDSWRVQFWDDPHSPFGPKHSVHHGGHPSDKVKPCKDHGGAGSNPLDGSCKFTYDGSVDVGDQVYPITDPQIIIMPNNLEHRKH